PSPNYPKPERPKLSYYKQGILNRTRESTPHGGFAYYSRYILQIQIPYRTQQSSRRIEYPNKGRGLSQRSTLSRDPNKGSKSKKAKSNRINQTTHTNPLLSLLRSICKSSSHPIHPLAIPITWSHTNVPNSGIQRANNPIDNLPSSKLLRHQGPQQQVLISIPYPSYQVLKAAQQGFTTTTKPIKGKKIKYTTSSGGVTYCLVIRARPQSLKSQYWGANPLSSGYVRLEVLNGVDPDPVINFQLLPMRDHQSSRLQSTCTTQGQRPLESPGRRAIMALTDPFLYPYLYDTPIYWDGYSYTYLVLSIKSYPLPELLNTRDPST
ncbi:hypothetical protein G9A89_000451, partial [Geosiphon pyriformis]